jgi:redox-sensitive bicupin YhaK (pirin superfamily)
MVYVYEGGGEVCGSAVGNKHVAQVEASGVAREVTITAGGTGLRAMVFAGKKLGEPIAWHGPIVMNTQAEINQCFQELRTGRFPPTRAGWDYKTLAAFPADHIARQPAL